MDSTAGPKGTSPCVMYLATGSLLAGTLLGVTARVAARRGRGRTVPRALHQTAFVTSSTLLAAAAVTQWPRHRTVSVANGAALLALTTLPRTSGFGRRHVQVAATAVSLHLVGVSAHVVRRHRRGSDVFPAVRRVPAPPRT